MCSVSAERWEGLIPSASAARDEMWLWKAVRSGITLPTTIPWRSLGFTAGTESKQAFPASQIRSRKLAFLTPNLPTPAPPPATPLPVSPPPLPPPPRGGEDEGEGASILSKPQRPDFGAEALHVPELDVFVAADQIGQIRELDRALVGPVGEIGQRLLDEAPVLADEGALDLSPLGAAERVEGRAAEAPQSGEQAERPVEPCPELDLFLEPQGAQDRKSTRLNSS